MNWPLRSFLSRHERVTATQIDDFIITMAIVRDGELTATEFSDTQTVPSILVSGGIFLTRVDTRVPDRPGTAQ